MTREPDLLDQLPKAQGVAGVLHSLAPAQMEQVPKATLTSGTGVLSFREKEALLVDKPLYRRAQGRID